MRLILLGMPGTGKGTQAAELGRRFGWQHISTGDMLRAAVAAGSEVGKKAKSFMDSGELVPDDLVIEILVERLRQADARNGCVFDGFPRNLAQAVALDEALAANGQEIDLALNFVASEEELLRRLSGRWLCPNCGAIYHLISQPPLRGGECDRCGSRLYQREDDKPETVRRRLETQRTPVELLEHYAKKGKLIEIDAAQGVPEVTEDVVRAVESVTAGSVN